MVALLGRIYGGGDFTTVNIRSYGRHNVRKHREINNGEQYIALDISLDLCYLYKRKVASSIQCDCVWWSGKQTRSKLKQRKEPTGTHQNQQPIDYELKYLFLWVCVGFHQLERVEAWFEGKWRPCLQWYFQKRWAQERFQLKKLSAKIRIWFTFNSLSATRINLYKIESTWITPPK